jgi:hypothetical protein
MFRTTNDDLVYCLCGFRNVVEFRNLYNGHLYPV